MKRKCHERYPQKFRCRAVERMNACDNIVRLARELRVNRTLLYKWRHRLELGQAQSEVSIRKSQGDLQGEEAADTNASAGHLVCKIGYFHKGSCQSVEYRSKPTETRNCGISNARYTPAVIAILVFVVGAVGPLSAATGLLYNAKVSVADKGSGIAMQVVFTVWASGTNLKVDFVQSMGSREILKGILLSRDHGQTVIFIDPIKKEHSKLNAPSNIGSPLAAVSTLRRCRRAILASAMQRQTSSERTLASR